MGARSSGSQFPAVWLANNVGTMIGACLAGHGVAQLLALRMIEDLLRRGKIVELFPDWPGERFPLYAFHLFSACAAGKGARILHGFRRFARFADNRWLVDKMSPVAAKGAVTLPCDQRKVSASGHKYGWHVSRRVAPKCGS